MVPNGFRERAQTEGSTTAFFQSLRNSLHKPYPSQTAQPLFVSTHCALLQKQWRGVPFALYLRREFSARVSRGNSSPYYFPTACALCAENSGVWYPGRFCGTLRGVPLHLSPGACPRYSASMSGPNSSPKSNLAAGLCSSCLHARAIESAKGSSFLLCQRSATDPAYPKYPRLPVLSCPGHEPVSQSAVLR